MNNQNRKLDISTLESWLWEAACIIRGAKIRSYKFILVAGILFQKGGEYESY